MKVNLTTFEQIHYPVYVLEEQRLRNNLNLIAGVAREAGIDIILAFKAYALWKTFPLFRQYIGARHVWDLKSSAVLRTLSRLHIRMMRLTKFHVFQVISHLIRSHR